VDLVAAFAFLLFTVLIIGLLVVQATQFAKERGWISDGTAGVIASRVGAVLVVIVYILSFIGQGNLESQANEAVAMLMGAFLLWLSVAPSGKAIYEIFKKVGWILPKFGPEAEPPGSDAAADEFLAFKGGREYGGELRRAA
jgi:hypothetical protein